jgi:hypothetical protein
VDGLDHAGGKTRLTTPAARASAALWHVTGSVYPVLAAQTLSPDPGDEDPNVPGGQLGQSLVAQLGDDVEADYALVPLVGAGPPLR